MLVARELRRSRDQAALRFRVAKAAGVELTTQEIARGLAKREDLDKEWRAFRLEVAGVWRRTAREVAPHLVGRSQHEIKTVLTEAVFAGLRRLARGGRSKKRTNEQKED